MCKELNDDTERHYRTNKQTNKGHSRFFCSHFQKHLESPSDFVPFLKMVYPVRFCSFLLVTGLARTLIRPTNVEESVLHPASFQYQFPGHVPMLFSAFFLGLFAQQRHSWLQPNTHQFFIIMLCCPLLPIDCSGLLQLHFLYIL